LLLCFRFTQKNRAKSGFLKSSDFRVQFKVSISINKSHNVNKYPRISHSVNRE
jgi:hypothetical protein